MCFFTTMLVFCIKRSLLIYTILVTFTTVLLLYLKILWKSKKIDALRNWKSSQYCNISCHSGKPCEYLDEVDFRIIVLVANRSNSLRKCLNRISEIHSFGDRIVVDIWIDRLKDGTIHEETRKVSRQFTKQFKMGRACYHEQALHSFIANQWINAYRPKVGTSEVAMILEDDIDVSPYVWKWYKAVHKRFRSANNIAGFTLKMDEATLRSPGKTNVPIKGPSNHTVILYNCFQAWGYSPHPVIWREFQDWYHSVRKSKSQGDIVSKIDLLEPFVPGSIHYSWWKTFQKKKNNFQESMAHEMWNIYFTNVYYPSKCKRNLYTVYSNLKAFTGRNNVQLCVNRKEKGLHYSGREKRVLDSSQLLTNWNADYGQFTINPVRLALTGQVQY